MEFSVTFDYLCPFARNTNEAVLAGLAAGAGWNVTFVPFSLAQVHTDPGEPSAWRAPEGRSGLHALQWGVAVRDRFPEAFPQVHVALFAARHDHGLDINDPDVVAGAVESCGVDAGPVDDIVRTGSPLETIAAEHQKAVADHQVFGVPTIIVDGEAVFVRMMDRASVQDLEKVLDLMSWTGLNEFKRTTVPR